MSLRQAYRDLILFAPFIGLISTFVVTVYYYLAYREPFYAMMAFISGLLATLDGIAEFVFRVEFWRAYVESWRKRRRKEK